MKNRILVPDADLIRLVAEYEAARIRWIKVVCSRNWSVADRAYLKCETLNDATRALALALGSDGQVVIDAYIYSVIPKGIHKRKKRSKAHSEAPPCSS